MLVVLILMVRPSNLTQNMRFHRLRATLNFGLQAPGGILEPSSWEHRKSTKARMLQFMSPSNKLNKLYQSSCAHGIAGQQRGDRERGAEWLSQGPAGACQEGAVV